MPCFMTKHVIVANKVNHVFTLGIGQRKHVSHGKTMRSDQKRFEHRT